MKKVISLLLSAALTFSLAACGKSAEVQPQPQPAPETPAWEGAVTIELSDDTIKVDGAEISHDETAAVHDAAAIVYYEEGHDFTYGEGEPGDAHSAEEAAAHTVVTITQPGEYVLRGKLSAGQIAVDLGKDAKEDVNAVVTLILDGVDITCSVAPAVIFYNVYECGSDDADTATKDVDTTNAGANVYINDGTENVVNGSYVARIYKPDSVVLSADGKKVEDAKKLHKYDAAFYSKMTMNVDGGEAGVLRINAENEGLDSELHLTINGGTIFINSGNDGINTNEDGVSVTTVNGGQLYITVTGETGEGDGIDSNGWLVINEGAVVAARACNNSMDSGIDSDMGIHIASGAFVLATGHMLDRIEGAGQNYAVFQFAGTQSGQETITLKNAAGEVVVSDTPGNDYSILLVSTPMLQPGEYTLWSGNTQLGHSGQQGGMMGGPGMMMPGGNFDFGNMPEGFQPDNMPEMPENFDPNNMPQMPEGFGGGMEMPQQWNGGNGNFPGMSEGRGGKGGDMQRPEQGQKVPEGGSFPGNMQLPEGFDPSNMPQNGQFPADFNAGNMPNMPAEMPQGGGFGGRPGGTGWGQNGGQSATEKTFTISEQETYFYGVSKLAVQ